ncbi:MAG: RimK family protein [Phycisphaerales bacterium]
MSNVIVVDNPKDWPLHIHGVTVVSARGYLTEPRFTDLRAARVFNLCKSYSYQSLGYYVSLLASARGHKPLPDITTIQDLKLSTMLRIAEHELEELIAESLSDLKPGTFLLSIYFGRNMAKRHERLALALFNLFPAPLLRAEFRHDGEKWELRSLRPIEADEIPKEHLPFVGESAKAYFTRPARRARKVDTRHDLAILFNESEPNPPSDKKALKKFIKAAESMGLDTEIITKDEYGRVAEFDALFLRDTTSVNHYTFRFSRRAQAEGLVVIDDPDSIVKCANKVYLAELLHRHRVPHPRTLIIHRGNCDDAPKQLGFPLVLKQPDSSFSLGVVKINTLKEYQEELEKLFPVSDLLIAQEFVPTSFDWRVGIIERQPLYVCQYFMAEKHWQIYDHTKTGLDKVGNFEAWPVDAAPPDVVRTAIRAANLIGDGLYGVDLKEINGKPVIVEINDNPSIETGVEDQILGDELYRRVMRVFLRRLESRGS